jgi:biopolymer transport protein ExbD
MADFNFENLEVSISLSLIVPGINSLWPTESIQQQVQTSANGENQRMSDKPQRKLSGKIAIDMTPMIDIVFQLLTFFVMTLTIASAEGDFNIQMPLNSRIVGTVCPPQLPPIHLYLQADEAGGCNRVVMNDAEFSGPDRWDRVHQHLAGIVGEGNLADEAEVELHCDPQLNYEHTIAAITAVSGRVNPADGQIVKLIDKIKFSPPR